MTRQIVLDTETTGLDPKQGHRIIEIACVEVANRQVTPRHYHVYVDPEREIEEGATNVHGLTWDDLRGKPKFHDIAADLLDFILDAELIIHNAPFDIGFLDHEFALAGRETLTDAHIAVVDTLKLARELHPGKRNNLDALCERYQIDNSQRKLHGALLDAALLAEVYLAMTRGQDALVMDLPGTQLLRPIELAGERQALLVLAASADELSAHEAYLDEIDRTNKAPCLWRRLASPGAPE
jgi:DNA polymerase-3 subunit epsilon